MKKMLAVGLISLAGCGQSTQDIDTLEQDYEAAQEAIARYCAGEVDYETAAQATAEYRDSLAYAKEMHEQNDLDFDLVEKGERIDSLDTEMRVECGVDKRN